MCGTVRRMWRSGFQRRGGMRGIGGGTWIGARPLPWPSPACRARRSSRTNGRGRGSTHTRIVHSGRIARVLGRAPPPTPPRANCRTERGELQPLRAPDGVAHAERPPLPGPLPRYRGRKEDLSVRAEVGVIGRLPAPAVETAPGNTRVLASADRAPPTRPSPMQLKPRTAPVGDVSGLPLFERRIHSLNRPRAAAAPSDTHRGSRGAQPSPALAGLFWGRVGRGAGPGGGRPVARLARQSGRSIAAPAASDPPSTPPTGRTGTCRAPASRCASPRPSGAGSRADLGRCQMPPAPTWSRSSA
jgi:hypothetical protein